MVLLPFTAEYKMSHTVIQHIFKETSENGVTLYLSVVSELHFNQCDYLLEVTVMPKCELYTSSVMLRSKTTKSTVVFLQL